MSTKSGLIPSVLRFLLFVLVYLNAGALWANTQFIEVPYAQEAYLAILVAFFVLAVVPYAAVTLSFPPGGLPALFIMLFVLAYSSLNACLSYGQPISYGIIEERRVLSYLIFFPLYYAIRSGLITTRQLMQYVLISTFLCFANAAAFYFLIARNVKIAFATETTARADRTMIGTFYVLLSYNYALQRWIEDPKSWRWLVTISLLLFDLVVFEQTRQLLACALFVSVIVLSQRPKLALRLLGFVGAAMLVVGIAAFSFVGTLVQKYMLLMSLGSNIAENVRSSTIKTIMAHNLLWGHGALSALWMDGFKRYYGRNFFLSDVGVFGTVFRYGLIGIVVLVLYYGYLFRVASKPSSLEGKTCRSYLMLCLLLNIFVPVMEFLGGYVALAAVTLICEKAAGEWKEVRSMYGSA